MLTLLILIPIIGSLLLLPIGLGEGEESLNRNNNQMKKIALTISLINFFVSLFIWYQFDSNTSQYQFVSEFNTLNFCHLHFGFRIFFFYWSR